jgi:hypothetical protein
MAAKLVQGTEGNPLHPRLGRIVAIKKVREQHSERFKQEARSIAALNHPNICQLYDIGPDYLVLEFVEGKPLSSPLPEKEAVRLAGGRPLVKGQTENVEAYNLCLKGRYHWYKSGDEDLTKCREYFGQAVSLDPDCAAA